MLGAKRSRDDVQDREDDGYAKEEQQQRIDEIEDTFLDRALMKHDFPPPLEQSFACRFVG
jgi:hypothetical protein